MTKAKLSYEDKYTVIQLSSTRRVIINEASFDGEKFSKATYEDMWLGENAPKIISVQAFYTLGRGSSRIVRKGFLINFDNEEIESALVI